MKTFRFISLLVIFIITISLWIPTPAMALSSSTTTPLTQVAGKKPVKPINIRVNNLTSGTVFIKLEGEKNYYFVAGLYGKQSFSVLSGKYKITITASACGGQIVKMKNIQSSFTLSLVCGRRR